MSDEPRRRPDVESKDSEEVARLRRQAHGVITGKSDLPLPLVPEPTRPGDAAPGPRAGTPRPVPPAPLPVNDTVPVPLMDERMSREGTPPPLPPSPASAAAEVWLEDAVTRPSALSDIAPGLSGYLSSSNRIPTGRAETDPIEALREAHAMEARTSHRLLLLSTTTAFAVGLAAGALLFRGCG